MLSLALLSVMAISALAAPNLAAQGVTSCPQQANVPGIDGNFANAFPPVGQIANIVQGDTVAQQLYQSIMNNATYADALAIQPTRLTGGNPVLNGYNAGSDPNCWWTAATCVASKRSYIPPDYSACNEQRVWGLTVDDGPVPDHCALYQLFQQNNITASLFYIGTNVINNPGSALEGFKAGHVVCVHTWSHRYTTSLTNAQVFAELYYTTLAIKRVTGFTPRCFRPPYGDVDDRVRAIALGLGLDVWLWKQDTNDWSADSGASAATINGNYQQIINAANGPTGVIVLTHELSLKVTSFFINNFAALSAAFSTAVVSAHVCSNITRPYAELNAPIWPSFQHYLGGARPNNGQALTPNTNATAQIFFAGQSNPKTGPDFIDLASMSSASAAAAATATPSSVASSAAVASGSAGVKAANTVDGLNATAAPLSQTVKIGIIAGSAGAGVLLIALALFFICRRRGSKPPVDRRKSTLYAVGADDLKYQQAASTSTVYLDKPGLAYSYDAYANPSTETLDPDQSYGGGPPAAAAGARYRYL